MVDRLGGEKHHLKFEDGIFRFSSFDFRAWDFDYRSSPLSMQGL